jgi:DNA-binding response OmpR family regulator
MVEKWHKNGMCRRYEPIDFLPLLSMMRSVTNTPILIVTSNFTTETEIAALENGADLFARWHENPSRNVASVMAHIARKSARNETTYKVLVHKNLLVSYSRRSVFVGNVRLDLTRREFDLIHTLAINEGNVLSYEQLYSLVWSDEFDGSQYETIKGLIKRLRRKIDIAKGEHISIQNNRGVGYVLTQS